MKNKNFKLLTEQKKEKHLIRVLREKTQGLLRVNEEVALVSAGMKKKQFRICVFFDINEFRNAMNALSFEAEDIAFGSSEVEKLKNSEDHFGTSMALFAVDVMDSKRKTNCLMIYVPISRKCNCECVREKYICEHIVGSDSDILCCDMQHMEA